jgi:nitrogen fixation NifU-like protein
MNAPIMGQFSDTFMEHFSAPRNSGAIAEPDRIGHAGAPGQGPFLILYLRLGDGCVVESKYQTYGCGATIAAGSVLTELIARRPVAACLALTEQDLIAALDGVPPNKRHGPALAITALRDALREFA